MKSRQTLTLTQAMELGLRHYQAGNLSQAEAIFRQILQYHPENSDALHLLGVLAFRRGDYAGAEKNIRLAIAHLDNVAPYHNSLGVVLQEIGRVEDACASFTQALLRDPNFAESQCNLGNIYLLENKLSSALDAYSKALSLQPELADAHSGLGKVFTRQNKPDEAKQCFDRALALNPRSVDAHNGMGMLLEEQQRHQEAARYFQQTIELNPHYADAHNNLGGALFQMEKIDEATGCFQRALTINPHFSKARLNLGKALTEQGMFDEALQHYQEAMKIEPSPGVQVKMACMLPVIPASVGEIKKSRNHIEENISRLTIEGVALKDPVNEVEQTNFYLSYHGLSNRDLQIKIAKFYEKACPSLLWTAPHCQGWTPAGGKIRIGFVSRFLYNHSIGKTTRGLIANLSKNRYETFALFVSHARDDEISRFIRAHSDRSIDLPHSLDSARDAIADLKLDILFYQDIGMEPLTYFLAFSRLAPVQCVSFGHPDTTGIRNMDYWISNDLFEPEGAESEYSEKLFLLHNLGSLAYYYRPKIPFPLKNRRAYGLDDNAHLYLCPQTLFKLHPEFDEILGSILRADPLGRVVLIESKVRRWITLLKDRFHRSIPDVADRVFFVPRQKGEDFLNLLTISDVMLDTIHFNGMNTSLEGFSMGIPIVTLPTAFQRGRHTLGMYTKMEINDCIARTKEEYVNIAVSLGTNNSFRKKVSEKILSRCGRLFEDKQVVLEFERFFESSLKK